MSPDATPAATIRPEAPEDAAAIRSVVTHAFGRADEAALVDALRGAGKTPVALVAIVDTRVVGHVLFSPVTLDGAPLGLGLAPLAVAPEVQHRGVGAALVRAGLAAVRDGGTRVVVVLGDPDYYRRFGFVAAESRRLRCEYDAPPGAFQVNELAPGALAGRSGLVRYAPEFAAV